MGTRTILFNPFSYSLSIHREQESKTRMVFGLPVLNAIKGGAESKYVPQLHSVSESYFGEPIYVNGDYAIYKKSDKHFLHCYKHVIFGERCGANEQLITDIKNDTFSGDGNQYHNFDRPKDYLAKGLEWSKKYKEFDD
jgi:hypothetical protein